MSILDSLLSLFAGSGGSEADKKRQLKQLAKSISHCKYKFYIPHSRAVTPSCGKFFFEIYKTVSSAQALLQNATASKVIRDSIIDIFMTEKQRAAVSRLSEESINERASTAPAELAAQVKQDISAVSSEFTTDMVQNIDKTYNLLVQLAGFSSFDYYFTLKKFNSNLAERNFSAVPAFETIRADYILDDLREFIPLAYGLPLAENWAPVFAAVKKIKGVDPVNPRQWNKMLSVLADVKKSGILELTVRHIAENPGEQFVPVVSEVHIVDEFIQKLRTTTDLLLQKIQMEKRNSKVGELAMQLFNTTEVVRLRNYTEKMNGIFSKKMLGGYIHVEALNYTKAFLLDYYKRDIRGLIDFFLIKGQWTSTVVSAPLSESFYAVLEISDRLIEFDDSLAQEGAAGQKIKSILNKIDRNKEQVNFLRNFLKDVNDKAYLYIITTVRNLITIGKILKQLLEDINRTQKELIINWPDLIKMSDTDIKQSITSVYRNIYTFVTLIQCFVKQE